MDRSYGQQQITERQSLLHAPVGEMSQTDSLRRRRSGFWAELPAQPVARAQELERRESILSAATTPDSVDGASYVSAELKPIHLFSEKESDNETDPTMSSGNSSPGKRFGDFLNSSETMKALVSSGGNNTQEEAPRLSEVIGTPAPKAAFVSADAPPSSTPAKAATTTTTPAAIPAPDSATDAGNTESALPVGARIFPVYRYFPHDDPLFQLLRMMSLDEPEQHHEAFRCRQEIGSLVSSWLYGPSFEDESNAEVHSPSPENKGRFPWWKERMCSYAEMMAAEQYFDVNEASYLANSTSHLSEAFDSYVSLAMMSSAATSPDPYAPRRPAAESSETSQATTPSPVKRLGKQFSDTKDRPGPDDAENEPAESPVDSNDKRQQGINALEELANTPADVPSNPNSPVPSASSGSLHNVSAEGLRGNTRFEELMSMMQNMMMTVTTQLTDVASRVSHVEKSQESLNTLVQNTTDVVNASRDMLARLRDEEAQFHSQISAASTSPAVVSPVAVSPQPVASASKDVDEEAAARTIGSAYKTYRLKKHLRHASAARKIQRAYRDWSCSYFGDRSAASLDVDEFRVDEESSSMDGGNEPEQEEAARRIQGAYKGFKERVERSDSARKIQAFVRGNMQRKKYVQLRRAVQALQKKYKDTLREAAEEDPEALLKAAEDEIGAENASALAKQLAADSDSDSENMVEEIDDRDEGFAVHSESDSTAALNTPREVVDDVAAAITAPETVEVERVDSPVPVESVSDEEHADFDVRLESPTADSDRISDEVLNRSAKKVQQVFRRYQQAKETALTASDNIMMIKSLLRGYLVCTRTFHDLSKDGKDLELRLLKETVAARRIQNAYRRYKDSDERDTSARDDDDACIADLAAAYASPRTSTTDVAPVVIEDSATSAAAEIEAAGDDENAPELPMKVGDEAVATAAVVVEDEETAKNESESPDDSEKPAVGDSDAIISTPEQRVENTSEVAPDTVDDDVVAETRAAPVLPAAGDGEETIAPAAADVEPVASAVETTGEMDTHAAGVDGTSEDAAEEANNASDDDAANEHVHRVADIDAADDDSRAAEAVLSEPHTGDANESDDEAVNEHVGRDDELESPESVERPGAPDADETIEMPSYVAEPPERAPAPEDASTESNPVPQLDTTDTDTRVETDGETGASAAAVPEEESAVVRVDAAEKAAVADEAEVSASVEEAPEPVVSSQPDGEIGDALPTGEVASSPVHSATAPLPSGKDIISSAEKHLALAEQLLEDTDKEMRNPLYGKNVVEDEDSPQWTPSRPKRSKSVTFQLPEAAPAKATDDASTSEEKGALPPAQLQYVLGGRVVHTFDVHSERVVVGRQRTCDIVISDARASREHFILQWTGSAFQLEDLGSRNKTYLNSNPVSGHALLSTGDIIRVGKVNLAFVVGDGVKKST